MSSIATLPIIDLDVFLSSADKQARDIECQKAADALIKYGALILHDSRMDEQDNSNFLDLLEDYFAQPIELLEEDVRPELHYQIGATLENTEKPKCAVHEPCLRVIEQLDPSERPLDILGHNTDPKCINAPNIIPKAFQGRWEDVLGKWGSVMKQAVSDLARITALGLGLEQDVFTDAAKYGPHILAPTASNLQKHGKKDTILAGFHTDLNFLTIHGRSRYPGLNIWARNTGKRIPVIFPPEEKFFLVQAGKQLEHITGGLIKAGYHEVIVNDATLAAMTRRAETHPDRPQVRISSTFFYHLSSDYDLAPVSNLAAAAARYNHGQLNVDEEQIIYEHIKVGHQVQNELKHIALMA